MPELRETIAQRLSSYDPNVSFYSAAILAIQGDSRAEPRLLQSITETEDGQFFRQSVKSEFGSVLDIPFWLQAAALLRICGTKQCIPVLAAIARKPIIFNIATLLALTCEKLLDRVSDKEAVLAIQETLLAHQNEESALLPTHRSISKILAGQQVDEKARSWGIDTSEDHLWQLHLIIARSAKRTGKPIPQTSQRYFRDPRAYVRTAFASL